MAYRSLMNLSNKERMHDDEDPMVIIEKRLQEVRQMSDGKKNKSSILARYTPDTRELIMKYTDIPAQQIRKSKRKKAPKLLDRFRRAVSLVQLLLRGFHGDKKYFIDHSNMSELRKKMETMVNQSSGVASGRASIGRDLQTVLCTQPHLRDKKSIKQILWVLRATKAFKHLFPAEMEEQVARHVAYERYEDGRILTCQGRVPDRFYYVMSGRVNKLRQYHLSTGQVTKSMGFLVKGMTTDPQELDMQWMREESLVAKGQVEVLLLDKKSFSALQHTTDGPPVDFLQSLHLFLEFPMDRFGNSHDSIEMKYYGQGKIVLKDSNRTPWLHIVKSGLVKVVRRQSVIDARLSNESKFASPTVEHLGCGKSFSHADAMLGTSVRQKKLKAMREGTILPQIDNKKGLVSKSRKIPSLSRRSGKVTFTNYIQTPGIGVSIDNSPNPFRGTLGFASPIVYRHPSSENGSVVSDVGYMDDDDDDDVDNVKHANQQSQHVHNSQRASGPVSPAKSNHGLSRSVETIPDYDPHDLWLTREKTGHESIYPRSKKKDLQHRRAYLQLDVLKPGDVFGLDHMQPPVASEPMGVTLLSDGAEIVKISKRFFLQNADNNTMLKVETMYKEYISEQEAESALYNKETWDQYKAALWNIMTAPSPIAPASSR